MLKAISLPVLFLAVPFQLHAQLIRATAVVSGRIVDERREGAHARVTLYARMIQEGHMQLFAACSVETDETGAYRCDVLRAGRYVMSATSIAWSAPPSKDQKDQSVSPQKQGGPKDKVPEGKETVAVYPLTYFPGASTLADAEILTLHDDQTLTANLTLRSSQGADLVVNLPVGPLVPGIKLLIAEPPGLPLRIAFLADEATGKYTFHNVPPGSYRVDAEWFGGNGPHHFVGLATVASGQPTVVRTHEVIPSRLSGTLKLMEGVEAKLPSGLELERVADEGAWSVRLRVAPDGSFKFPSLEEGDYVLHLPNSKSLYVRSLLDGQYIASSQRFHVSGDGRVILLTATLARAYGVIQGTVQHPEQLMPQKAAVLLIASDGHTEVAALQPDGRFEFTALAPGSYSLLAVSSVAQAEYRSKSFRAAHTFEERSISVGDNASQVERTELPIVDTSL